jgi:hypothetical protein
MIIIFQRLLKILIKIFTLTLLAKFSDIKVFLGNLNSINDSLIEWRIVKPEYLYHYLFQISSIDNLKFSMACPRYLLVWHALVI